MKDCRPLQDGDGHDEALQPAGALGVGGNHVFAGDVPNDVSDEVVAVGVAEHVAVHGSWLDKLVPLGDTGGGFACSCRPTSGGPTVWVVIPRRRATSSGARLHETFTVATVDASSLRSTLLASGQTGRWHRER
jgi:hypothetical protein